MAVINLEQEAAEYDRLAQEIMERIAAQPEPLNDGPLVLTKEDELCTFNSQ